MKNFLNNIGLGLTIVVILAIIFAVLFFAVMTKIGIILVLGGLAIWGLHALGEFAHNIE